MTTPGEQRTRDEFPHDADQARADIEVTRAELAETVGELTHRLNVPARAKERASALAAGARQKLPSPVIERASGGLDALRRNPKPVAAGGALVLAGLLLRRRRRRSR